MRKNGIYGNLKVIFLSIREKAKRFFYTGLFKGQNILSEKEEQGYWKDKNFYYLSVSFITCGAVLLSFGAYMFYSHGQTQYAIVELMVYFIITVVITRKSLSVGFRKVFFTLSFYLISILLLITTGLMGGGMVCVCFSLIFAGLLLEKRHIKLVVIINIIIFIILTVLLMNGYLDNTNMITYKSVWQINALTGQAGGILLLYLMNSIFSGLEKQAQLINKSKETLIASDIKHKAMIANISDVILIVDEKGIVTYNSPNLNQSFSWIAEDITNKSFYEVLQLENRNYISGELHRLLKKDGMKQTMEAKYLRKDGSIGYIVLTSVNLTKDPYINGVLINFHDITERKMREDKILHLNYHDSLTGLYNRVYFEMEKEVLDTKNQLPLSIITGDINGLKIINDALGHTEGDKLLITIAKIFSHVCRDEDIIARFGGDEFYVLMPNTSRAIALDMVDKISSACKEYNNNMSSDLNCISIALGTATKESMKESLDSIFRIAEDHMYKRKLLESRSLHSSIIASMKTVLYAKSQETEEHAQRLTKLTKVVGRVLGLTEQQYDELELFSTLHDIGKIGIDDQILNKPGKLTDEEWVIMRKHSEIGYRIALVSPELMSVAGYILTHHEHWDGKGYPQGLSGENIPLLSRILALADAYDAMTEDRPYRKAMPKQEAITEIINNAGTQFDPNITKIFVDIVADDKFNYDSLN